MTLIATWVLALLGCTDAPGDPCTVTGEGFTRTDSCRGPFQRDGVCVAWDVQCPDEAKRQPDVCAGGGCTADGDCDQGWFCASINATDERCLPRSVCPGS